MNDRGSYTIELSIVISIILVVIAMVLFRFGRAFELVITDRHDPTIYQEAFLEKIEELRLEKIMKEKKIMNMNQPKTPRCPIRIPGRRFTIYIHFS